MKWEYKIINFSPKQFIENNLEENLNKYGNERWEAVSIIFHPNGYATSLLKRGINDTAN